MPIYSAGRRVAGIGVGHHRKEPAKATIMLTPVIDMFTILLVFLLMNFQAGGRLKYTGEDIMMPLSTSDLILESSVEIAINNEQILIDGEKILDDVESITTNGDLMIPVLFQALEMKAEEFREREATDLLFTFTGKVIIQGDRDIPFRLLKKIIYTADRADFTKQSLAVLQR
ncbi:biopolymer transporter ExbD [Thermodesulfobacteriota bacterium]